MRIKFLCFSVLRVTSGPRVKLAGGKKASSPEPKSHLTQNLVGSIWVTCRSKLAKIVPVGNPR